MIYPYIVGMLAFYLLSTFLSTIYLSIYYLSIYYRDVGYRSTDEKIRDYKRESNREVDSDPVKLNLTPLSRLFYSRG